ncbi:HD-GYP domain-containing protein [Pelosinus sp. sgz500959]|uniref:HD-GYP domain-containing protein n=1 Tax=Pelosinus sp. sgz500959 TaxID=3242472 RepID=UPI003672131C
MSSIKSQKIIEQRIEFLVPGMELARDVYTSDGKILASVGTIINKTLIKKLHNWDIDKVSIITEIEANPITDPKIQQFINSYNQSVTVVQKAFDDIRQTQQVPLETFTRTADDIVDNVSTTGNAIDQLYNLPQCDDYTFRHSVNVSAISALIATWLKFPPESVSAIALAGLLHDVGKSQLPPEILNQSHRLAPKDYELYKTHTTLGYDLVKKTPGIAESVLSGILDHHEREDGNGYPNKLTSEDIHPYAKVIAVADLFDESLTINCDTPGALSPYSSLDKLRQEIYSIDAKTCMTFTENMMNFLSGNLVTLTNGQQGRVVFVNKDKPSNSIVLQEDGTVIDLSEIDGLYIHYMVR